MAKAASGVRYAEVERETRHVKVQVVLDLDGGTRCDVDTGVAFLDHMLHQMAAQGRLDLGVQVEQELNSDDEHIIREVGATLGLALRQALVDELALNRFGSIAVPMDDALVVVALDLSGRGMLALDLPLSRERVGDMPTQSVKPFFHGLAVEAGVTLHVKALSGDNDHHLIESAFKGFGVALRQATERHERKPGSSKGRMS